MEQKILIILTGGLIAAGPDSTEMGHDSNLCSKKSIYIIESIKDTIDLKTIELIEFSVIDSSSIDLEFLEQLAKLVQRKIIIIIVLFYPQIGFLAIIFLLF